jgi:hypothetical protein
MTAETDPKSDADRVAGSLLKMWADALDTPDGREIVTAALCQAMQGVAGADCARVCPMGNTSPRARALLLELQAVLGAMAVQSIALTASVERAEFLAEKVA